MSTDDVVDFQKIAHFDSDSDNNNSNNSNNLRCQQTEKLLKQHTPECLGSGDWLHSQASEEGHWDAADATMQQVFFPLAVSFQLQI